MPHNSCPVCDGADFRIVADEQQLQQECGLRERFVQRRLTRQPDPDELKDLTEFFHAEKADIFACSRCGLLIRNEHEPPPAQEYSEDEYDPSVMDRQYPDYLEAFRRKEEPYRCLLPEGARVVEVGSHYGAFLQAAEEWGWRAEGADPGKDTSRFAKSKGFTVHVATLEECAFEAGQFDGVFIWNCFEQIDNPKPTLEACRRILKAGGLLTVRTPDGQFYAACGRVLRDASLDSEARDFLLRVLGYNNLLGFPYLYGYSRSTLTRLIEPSGFTFEGALGAELIKFPLPEIPRWVEKEEQEISSELRRVTDFVVKRGSGDAMGPWLEAWFRAA